MMLLVNHLLQIWQTTCAQGQHKEVMLLTQRHFGTYLARTTSSEYMHAAFAALMRVANAENPEMQIACLTTDLMAKSVKKVAVKVARWTSGLGACQPLGCSKQHCSYSTNMD